MAVDWSLGTFVVLTDVQKVEWSLGTLVVLTDANFVPPDTSRRRNRMIADF